MLNPAVETPDVVGVELARTPYVAFADDDSYWAPGSLRQAAKLMRTYERIGLLAAQVLVGPDARLDSISAAMAAAPLGVPADGPGPSVLGFLACAAVVRRERSSRWAASSPQCTCTARRHCSRWTWPRRAGGCRTHLR